MARPRLRYATSLRLEGPLFVGDPGRTIRENVRRLMAEIGEAAAEEIRTEIASIPPAGIRTGRTRQRIRGRAKSLKGKQWTYNAVVSPDMSGLSARDAIALMAAASEIESRHGVFRRAASRVRRIQREGRLVEGLG